MKALLETYLDQDWTYHHWPHYQPVEAYHEAEAEYLAKLQRIPSLRAVWRFGSVGVPGISDLDYMVVLEDDALYALSPDMITRQDLSPTSRYIIFHEPFVVNQDLLVAWNRWGNGATLTHLYGDETAPEALSPDEQEFVAAVTLSDLLMHVEPRLFLETLLSGNMHVRGTLCQINASKHLLRLYKQIMQASTMPWDNFFIEFETFRKQWFTLGPDREFKLKGYLIQAVMILFEFIERLHETLVHLKWFDPQTSGTVSYLAAKYITVWRAAWSSEHPIQKIIHVWAQLHRVAVMLPASLALPILVHASANGMVSHYVQRNMGPSDLVPADWHRALQQAAHEQATARNAHVAFLQRKGLFQLDAAYFGLGLWPKYVSKNPLHKYPRRVYYRLRKQQYWKSLSQILNLHA